MRNKSLPLFMLAATAILWSMAGLLIKKVDWNPIGITGGRSLFALIVFLPFMRKLNLRKIGFNTWMGAICYCLTIVLFVSANKTTTAANAILLQYTAPVYVILLSGWLLHERITRVDLMCVGGVLAGLVLFVFESLQGGHWLGDGLALLSGLFFAGIAIFLRRQKDADPMHSILLGNIMTALVCLPIGMMISTPGKGSFPVIAILGIFQLGLSYLMYSIAIRYVPAVQVLLLCALEPILNPIWVFLGTGEKPGVFALLGGGVVMLAVVLHSIFKREDKQALEVMEEGEHAH